MVTLKQWMEVVNYRITEGDAWNSEAFGSNAHCLSAWNGVHGAGGWSLNIVFDTETQLVYQVEVCDYTNDRAYRIINPLYKAAAAKEAQSNEYADQAWDDVNYTDLETDEDWLDKATAIVNGEEYDNRVSIPIDLPEHELMVLFKRAHEEDLTFNDFVEKILREALANEEFISSLKEKHGVD